MISTLGRLDWPIQIWHKGVDSWAKPIIKVKILDQIWTNIGLVFGLWSYFDEAKLHRCKGHIY